jgi:hypothetical protein
MKNIKRFEDFQPTKNRNNILSLTEKLLLETRISVSDEMKSDLYKSFSNTNFNGTISNLLDLQGKDLELKRTNKDVIELDSIPHSNMIDIGGKNQMKFGKVLKLLLPDTPDTTLAEISNIWNGDRDYDSQKANIKVVDGYRLKSYYDCSNYAKGYEQTVLGKSCMNKMYNNVFNFYAENPNIKMLVSLDDNGDLLARALLFNTKEKGIVMDNVYYIKEKSRQIFANYADEQGWEYVDFRKPHEGVHAGLLTVELKQSEYEHYPFLDHFQFLNIEKKLLSTEHHQWKNSGDNVIKINDNVNNKWEQVYGDESYAYEKVIYSDVLPDDWEVYYDAGVLDLDDLLDLGVTFHRFKKDVYDSEFSSIYNDVSSYIDEDDAIDYFEEQDDITQIEYAVKGGFNIADEIIINELTDEEELGTVMTKYFNDGTTREYDDLEDARDDIETIIGEYMEHKEQIENEPKHYKFIEFFLEEVYGVNDIEIIEDYNRDNWKEVIDGNQLEDEMTTAYLEKKYKDIDTVSELLREEGRDSDEEKQTTLNYNWHQETFIENAREQGYNLNDMVDEINRFNGGDEDDEDDY